MFWRKRDEDVLERLVTAVDAITKTALAQAQVAEAQAKAIEAHVGLFRIPEEPTTRGGWVNRDEDEYMAELERKGFPAHGTDEERLKWVREHSLDPDIQEYELRPVNE